MSNTNFSRVVTIPNGAFYTVPKGVTRIDHGNTHGWQVRHVGEDATKPTKYFPDFSLGGSAFSLQEAIKELISRLQANPPVHINEARKSTLANKKDKTLPAGVYGPTERDRTKVRRGKKVFVKEWSYDAAALKMDPKTGKTRSLIRHFTWTGGPRSSARAVKLKTATEWREAKFKEYTEACDQWDEIRNRRRLAETRKALAELRKKEGDR